MGNDIKKPSERVNINISRRAHEKLRKAAFKQNRPIKAIIEELVDKNL